MTDRRTGVKRAGRRRDDGGAVVVEYALLMALVVLVAVVGVAALGLGVNPLFDGVNLPG